MRSLIPKPVDMFDRDFEWMALVSFRRPMPGQEPPWAWYPGGGGRARPFCSVRSARPRAASTSRRRRQPMASRCAGSEPTSARTSAPPRRWSSATGARWWTRCSRSAVSTRSRSSSTSSPIWPGPIRHCRRSSRTLRAAAGGARAEPRPAAAVRLGAVVHGRPAGGQRTAAGPGGTGTGRPDA